MIIVSCEMLSGTKCCSTMARPEMLDTAAWLGTRKKKTATAMIVHATVISRRSFRIRR